MYIKELGFLVAWSLQTMKNMNSLAEGNLKCLQILWEWAVNFEITDGAKKNCEQTGQNLKLQEN